jgi:isoleucyl-tRNA synthetase
MNEKFADEISIMKFWKQQNIVEKRKEKNKGNPVFNTIDGPPYPTGEIHVGHLRNWSIKDAVIRYKKIKGFDVYAKDGYDVQGLPVEEKVQKKLGIKTVQQLKEFGEENFVRECKKFVQEVIDDMKERRERYGLWMDRNYYHTSHPEYLSLSWRFFKEADKKGLLYKDYKTVAWCPHDETTLSDYEVKDEYTTLEDPSIYVKFPLKEKYQNTYEQSLVIWTTTPWTLQSNMAIAVNPKFNYAKALVELNGNKEILIIGESLVEQVIEKLSKSNEISLIKIVETLKGAELEGLEYQHIYLEETPSQQEFVQEKQNNSTNHKHIHTVILADYVTLDGEEDIIAKLEKKGSHKHEKETTSAQSAQTHSESKDAQAQSNSSEGTGLVHIAPGHGQEDYEAAKKYNIPVFCPVGPDGTFTEGKYQGQYFRDVNPIAIDYLKEKGYLLHAELKSHRYPCCWRCKTPICYRAAEQWWIKRSQIIPEIIKENQNVQWFPEFAKKNFDHLMQGAGDWAISRQRYWGTPLPIFEDEEGNYKVFGSKEELEQEIIQQVKQGRTPKEVLGENSPYAQSNELPSTFALEDIHRDDLKDITLRLSPNSESLARPVPFIGDVWFDSGCASFASHYGEGLSYEEIIEKYYPIKWIVEGQDQIRGWFSSLFNVGYVLTGKAPYNQVLYHQFIMAKDGTKMSKSKGNGITGLEALETLGADATRYYLLTKRAPEDQINFDKEEFSLVYGFFNTVKNSIKFANAYLEEYDASKATLPGYQALNVEDKWILHQLYKTQRTFERKLETYQLHQAFKKVEEFIVQDFSKTYLKIIKERCEERDEALLIIFNTIIKTSLQMLGCSAPFLSEKLYQECTLQHKQESLFLEDLKEYDEYFISKVEEEQIDKNFEIAQEIIQAILNAREKAKIGVRWPLGKVHIISTHQALFKEIEPFHTLIKSLTNIVSLSDSLEGVSINYIIKPNFKTLKQDFENPSDAIKAINLSKHYIAQDIKQGISKGTYEGVELDLEKHIIKEIELEGELTSSDFSQGSIILETHQDDILLEQGYLREIIRRVQLSRKELGCEKSQKISLSFAGSDKELLELTQNWEGHITKKVGAQEILEKELEHQFTYTIKEKTLVVSIKK